VTGALQRAQRMTSDVAGAAGHEQVGHLSSAPPACALSQPMVRPGSVPARPMVL
jgi:hypothetical protein